MDVVRARICKRCEALNEFDFFLDPARYLHLGGYCGECGTLHDEVISNAPVPCGEDDCPTCRPLTDDNLTLGLTAEFMVGLDLNEPIIDFDYPPDDYDYIGNLKASLKRMLDLFREDRDNAPEGTAINKNAAAFVEFIESELSELL